MFLAKALLISFKGFLVFFLIIPSSVSADILSSRKVETMHLGVTLAPIDMAAGSGYSVTELAQKFIELNCQRCHGVEAQRSKDRSYLKNLFSIKVNNGTNPKKVPYLYQYLDLDAPLNSTLVRVLETHFNNDYNSPARNQGVYLSRMLAGVYAQNQVKKTPKGFLSWLRSLFAAPDLETGEKVKAPSFGSLKIEREFFDIAGANANQGVEFLSDKDFVFANGYVNSIALAQGSKFKFQKIMNIVDDWPALMSDVAVSSSGDIFVTSYRLGKLHRFDKNLENHQVIFEGLDYPLGVDISDKYIYIANSNQHSIVKLDMSGKLVWEKTIHDQDGRMFHEPYGVVADPNNGNVFVSFNREEMIIKMSGDGRLLASVGPNLPDGSRMGNIQGIGMDRDGNVYLVDTANLRLLVFDNELKLDQVLFHPNIVSLRGLAVARDALKLLISGFSPTHPPTSDSNSGVWLFSVDQ